MYWQGNYEGLNPLIHPSKFSNCTFCSSGSNLLANISEKQGWVIISFVVSLLKVILLFFTLAVVEFPILTCKGMAALIVYVP